MCEFGLLLILIGSGLQSTYGYGERLPFPRGREVSPSEYSKIFPYNEAPKNEYPFTVYTVNEKSNLLCTATLIDRQWVLTAAHCLEVGAKQVIVADYDRADADGQEQIIEIKTEIRHPNYNSTTKAYDVGLIELESNVNIGADGAGLISLLISKTFYDKMMANEKNCRVAGWGLTRTNEVGWFVPNRLLHMDVRFANSSELMSRGYETFPESHFGNEVNYDGDCPIGSTCFGDSGGPVFCRNKGEWVQTGITSFLLGLDGCILGIKGVTNVYFVSSWIQETMLNSANDTETF